MPLPASIWALLCDRAWVSLHAVAGNIGRWGWGEVEMDRRHTCLVAALNILRVGGLLIWFLISSGQFASSHRAWPVFDTSSWMDRTEIFEWVLFESWNVALLCFYGANTCLESRSNVISSGQVRFQPICLICNNISCTFFSMSQMLLPSSQCFHPDLDPRLCFLTNYAVLMTSEWLILWSFLSLTTPYR